MTVILAAVSAAYLLFLVAVEAWCVIREEPTISRRVQGWVKDNYQIAVALAAVAGWLLAHFCGLPG
jgi:hypothetical protein